MRNPVRGRGRRNVAKRPAVVNLYVSHSASRISRASCTVLNPFCLRNVVDESVYLIECTGDVRTGASDNVRSILNGRVCLAAVDRGDLRVHAAEEIRDGRGRSIVRLEHVAVRHVRCGTSDADDLLVRDAISLDAAVGGLRAKRERAQQ